MRDRGRGRAEAVRTRFFQKEEEKRTGSRDRAEDRQGPQRPDPRRTEFAQGRPVHHRAAGGGETSVNRNAEFGLRNAEWDVRRRRFDFVYSEFRIPNSFKGGYVG